MNRIEQIRYLNNILLQEMPAYKNEAEHFPENEREQRRLLRSLMNVRPPMPLKPEFLEIQDMLLSAEREEKGVLMETAFRLQPETPGWRFGRAILPGWLWMRL